jgi:F-type H+-transporting ATPase subunit b
METFFYLATEEVSGGFGLNLNILGSNLINLVVIVSLLIVYGGKFLGNILTERRTKIEEEIKEAENLKAQAFASLTEGQKNLAQAQDKAKQIKADAEASAKRVSEEILAQGNKEIERMKLLAVQELDSERTKVIAELKQTIAVLALKKAEQQLKETLNEEAQGQLISNAIGQLGG